MCASECNNVSAIAPHQAYFPISLWSTSAAGDAAYALALAVAFLACALDAFSALNWTWLACAPSSSRYGEVASSDAGRTATHPVRWISEGAIRSMALILASGAVGILGGPSVVLLVVAAQVCGTYLCGVVEMLSSMGSVRLSGVLFWFGAFLALLSSAGPAVEGLVATSTTTCGRPASDMAAFACDLPSCYETESNLRRFVGITLLLTTVGPIFLTLWHVYVSDRNGQIRLSSVGASMERGAARSCVRTLMSLLWFLPWTIMSLVEAIVHVAIHTIGFSLTRGDYLKEGAAIKASSSSRPSVLVLHHFGRTVLLTGTVVFVVLTVGGIL